MTEAETKLWSRIRDKQLGVKFRRQQPMGDYIVDFVCFKNKLIIEIDGGQHCDNRRDKQRDRWFCGQGFNVIRFWNNDVLSNLDGVTKTILNEITPSPLSPPVKGGGKT